MSNPQHSVVIRIQTSLSKPSTPWIAILAGLALWGAILIGWLKSYQATDIRTQLITFCPVFLWLGFLSCVVALWLNRETFRKFVMQSGTRLEWLSAGLVCLLAFALVHGVAPRVHRLFYDEDIYEAIGLDIAHNNQAAMINDGRWAYGHFQSKLMEFNKQPNAWPFVLSLAYRIFGVSEKIGFNLANMLFVLTVLGLFIAGGWLYGSPLAGLLAALAYCTIPTNVRWFSTMDGDPPTACFTVLAVLFTLFFFHTRTRAALFLCVSAWAFAAQSRFEVFLLAGLVFIMFYIDGWDEFKAPRLYACLVWLLILLTAHFVQLYVVREESWGAHGDKMALPYFYHNLKTNTAYYFNGKDFPPLFSWLALAGLAWPGDWKARLYSALWFLLSWGIFLFFYAGSYQYGADVRYSIMSMAPLALLAGRGADRFIAAGSRWFQEAHLRMAMFMMLIVTILFYLPKMRAVGEESWQCRADHVAAEYFSTLIPADGIVLTHNPNMFQIFGKNAAQMSLFAEHSGYADQVLKPQFHDKIYLHWNYWCNTQDAAQVRFCTDILASHNTELVAETKVADQRFALYRVVGDR